MGIRPSIATSRCEIRPLGRTDPTLSRFQPTSVTQPGTSSPLTAGGSGHGLSYCHQSPFSLSNAVGVGIRGEVVSGATPRTSRSRGAAGQASCQSQIRDHSRRTRSSLPAQPRQPPGEDAGDAGAVARRRRQGHPQVGWGPPQSARRPRRGCRWPRTQRVATASTSQWRATRSGSVRRVRSQCQPPDFRARKPNSIRGPQPVPARADVVRGQVGQGQAGLVPGPTSQTATRVASFAFGGVLVRGSPHRARRGPAPAPGRPPCLFCRPGPEECRLLDPEQRVPAVRRGCASQSRGLHSPRSARTTTVRVGGTAGARAARRSEQRRQPRPRPAGRPSRATPPGWRVSR